MNILIIGSGGREDALAWKLCQEQNIKKVYICPGNAGMQRLEKAETIPMGGINELINFSLDNHVHLCICGPEAPLTEGLADHFSKAGIAFFGPSAQAARLEGSKIFSKEFMARHNIPTAKFKVAESYEEAIQIIEKWDFEKGIVLKADGLAGGKGVVVTHSQEEAKDTIFDFMKNPDVSIKTSRLLLEDILIGEEVSCFGLCAEENFIFLGSACDHKRVGDGDTGANTGGMGCFRDRKWPDQTLQDKVIEQVLKPTLAGLKSEGTPFTGFLFMGLMIDEGGNPWVIEYNVRMGDPETQTLIPLLVGDLGSALFNMVNGGPSIDLALEDKDSVHVVLTSGGYPSIGKHEMSLGHEIHFVNTDDDKSEVFFAGVRAQGEKLINSGGRVLGVTCVGSSVEDCRKQAYTKMEGIELKDSHYRRDIGERKRGSKS